MKEFAMQNWSVGSASCKVVWNDVVDCTTGNFKQREPQFKLDIYEEFPVVLIEGGSSRYRVED